jgi:hypothetical protein
VGTVLFGGWAGFACVESVYFDEETHATHVTVAMLKSKSKIDALKRTVETLVKPLATTAEVFERRLIQYDNDNEAFITLDDVLTNTFRMWNGKAKCICN